MDSEKKLRFFGDGEAFGDGGFEWVYIGDSPDKVAKEVHRWIQNRSPNDECFIKSEMMTDSEIEALP